MVQSWSKSPCQPPFNTLLGASPRRVFSFSYELTGFFHGDDTILFLESKRVEDLWLQSLDVYCRRLGEHRRWSQSGHNKSAILTN
jgi:hypothetical protein